MAQTIDITGARVHNLKRVDVQVPIGKMVAVAGVSGSGKSSLALGVLYAEGSRRYLEGLSTYTRRRIAQSGEAKLDAIEHVPPALALHQRPSVPGIRSTFGTMSELLNSLRLMTSRLGNYTCPNGHMLDPTPNVALERPIICPVCGAEVQALGAEDLAFNSGGACPTCSGTGIVRTVDDSTLIADPNLTIEQGAVAPWRSLMWSVMVDVCREMGVRTDVPYKDLTAHEKEIVLHGPAEKRHIMYHLKKQNRAGEMDFTYFSAARTVLNALDKAKDAKGLKRVEPFIKEEPCPDCHGTRLNERARTLPVHGKTLPEQCAMQLDELAQWVQTIPGAMPADMREMAQAIVDEFTRTARRLLELGLGYLTLDRAGSTLSTGERQRIQLARAVRSELTGAMYVLDEPSIGLHPANMDGLLGVMRDLKAQGNTVIVVDHDTRVLRATDWIIEMGPGAGAHGGTVIAQGTVGDVERSPHSFIAPFLASEHVQIVRPQAAAGAVFNEGTIEIKTAPLHTVHALDARVPKHRLTVVTGVSGSGKTTLVLESLVPALTAKIADERMPEHVRALDAPGIERVTMIDATPIGANVRSTVATYSGVLDDLRRLFARTEAAKARGLTAGAFSYNTGSLRCPTCDGTGQITLDVQFLPDVDIDCPDCHGTRYSDEADETTWEPKGGHAPVSLPDLLAMTVDEAREVFAGTSQRRLRAKLDTLHELGIGYMTLGESTPALSGGEAQRLKLASEMGRAQEGTLFVFDEPTIGLHPLDVRTLIGVFQKLIDHGASVLVIEHDLDMIANADWIIDMGPGGGQNGGEIVATGTPAQVAENPLSLTGRYLKPCVE
ncbi:excinuclease ABC subunit A [Bifidobacterium pseudolongum subsp. pseudolongum]|uniref:excinuclease ABC subunit UvrA n=1 Tax=Bifidobacterium pseudolongum TaxID=1694 RepID=UPI000C70A156|nr:excinuclease ABC subunit UvrA [Bifidobacterium pseudolongum]PKV09164.1 excinuclease ABC subunit A [Bifidobacterium pseudolongum subsp. pseudolongum]RYQ51792.1 excinuclease ABC subunit A [Bifidobacterium pseudolongum subsp. pseudolongum]